MSIPEHMWTRRSISFPAVDLRGKLEKCQGILPEDVRAYDELIGPDKIVLLNTGWGKMRDCWNLEYGHDWPYITGELAAYFAEKKIKGVGIDALSIGGWYEGTGRPCHEILLSKEIWALEELLFPDELMEYKTCYMNAYPLKLKGFSGSMVRAVAVVEV